MQLIKVAWDLNNSVLKNLHHTENSLDSEFTDASSSVFLTLLTLALLFPHTLWQLPAAHSILHTYECKTYSMNLSQTDYQTSAVP